MEPNLPAMEAATPKAMGGPGSGRYPKGSGWNAGFSDAEKHHATAALDGIIAKHGLVEQSAGGKADAIVIMGAHGHVWGQSGGMVLPGAEKSKGVQQTVELDQLHRGQGTVSEAGIRKVIESGFALDTEAPKVARYKGELYVQSGHTRLTALALAGRTTASVDVVDYDDRGRLKQHAEDAPVKHKGLLVAAWLDPATAHELAADEGEAEEKLHITLVYIPECPPASAARVVAEVAAVAAQEDPLDGEVSGMGRFMASATSDGQDVIYAVPDVPGLSSIRERIADGLRGAGFEFDKEHGWTPHITLKYIDPGEPTPFSEPQAFGGPGSGRYPRGSGKNPKDRGPKLDLVKYDSPADFIAKVTADEVRRIYGLAPEMKVDLRRQGSQLNVFIEGGKDSPIDRMVRQFKPDGEVHHDLLTIKSGQQGEGFAAKMNAAAEEHYKASGFTHITLNADIDVGKYAWARQGYDFAKSGSHKQHMIDHARQQWFDLNPAGALTSNAIKIPDSIKSWELAALDDGHRYRITTNWGGKLIRDPDGPHHFGKAVMLSGHSWNGEKSLVPGSTSQQIGDSYYKAKGVKK